MFNCVCVGVPVAFRGTIVLSLGGDGVLVVGDDVGVSDSI